MKNGKLKIWKTIMGWFVNSRWHIIPALTIAFEETDCDYNLSIEFSFLNIFSYIEFSKNK